MRTIPLLLFAACSGLGREVDDWHTASFVDNGDVCFSPGQDNDVLVLVTAPSCLSSSCTRDFVGSCSASTVGDTVTLTSDLHWEVNLGDVDCTADCGIPSASCEIAGLDEGTYTVVHGADEYDLEIPLTEPCPPF